KQVGIQQHSADWLTITILDLLRPFPSVGKGEAVEAVPHSSPGALVTTVSEVQPHERVAACIVVAEFGEQPVALAPRVGHQLPKTCVQGDGKEILAACPCQAYVFADPPPERAGQRLVPLELVRYPPRQTSLRLPPRLLRVLGTRGQEPSRGDKSQQ